MSDMDSDDAVTYQGRVYRLSDLAHYADYASREALHSDWSGAEDDSQGWWEEYARRHPEDALHCAECAPEIARG